MVCNLDKAVLGLEEMVAEMADEVVANDDRSRRTSLVLEVGTGAEEVQVDDAWQLSCQQ